jgi:hypothetical protein
VLDEIYDRVLERVALHISYGATKEEIREVFLSQGITDEGFIFLFYTAGKLLYESREGKTDPDLTPASGIRAIPAIILVQQKYQGE